MSIIVQPFLIDRIKIQAIPQQLMNLKATDTNARINGITKQEATMNATYYADLHGDHADMGRHAGKPVIRFTPTTFEAQRAKKVSIRAYKSFSIWIFGNPTEYQKKQYLEEGKIDADRDQKERRHEENYIHTSNCAIPPEKMERDNRSFVPDVWPITEWISKEILGHQPTGWENPTLYTTATIDTLEITQDLLVQEDSTSLQLKLVGYLQSRDGHNYLLKTGVQKVTTYEEYTHPGISIELDYGTNGKLKIYAKTHHSIRTEALLYGNQHINKKLGKKSLDLLDNIIEQMAKPLIQNANIPQVLETFPKSPDITQFLFETFIQDPTELNMAKKLYEGKLLQKNEAPPKYRRMGTRNILVGHRMGKNWYYKLRPEITGGTQ